MWIGSIDIENAVLSYVILTFSPPTETTATPGSGTTTLPHVMKRILTGDMHSAKE